MAERSTGERSIGESLRDEVTVLLSSLDALPVAEHLGVLEVALSTLRGSLDSPVTSTVTSTVTSA